MGAYFVAGLLCFVCNQGTYGTGTHLVARGPRRSTDGGFCNFGRSIAETWNIRAGSLLASTLPGSYRVLHTLRIHNVCTGGCGHKLDGHSTNRHEAYHCVRFGCPHERDPDWGLQFDGTRGRRGNLPNAKPRNCLKCSFPVRGGSVRPSPHPFVEVLRWGCARNAHVRNSVPGIYHGEHCFAWNKQLCGRVFDSPRGFQRQHGGRLWWSHRNGGEVDTHSGYTTVWPTVTSRPS